MAVHAGPPGLDGHPGGQGQEGRVGPLHTPPIQGPNLGVGGRVHGACQILKKELMEYTLQMKVW